MIFVLSPAKTLDFSPPDVAVEPTRPVFAGDTAALARVARTLKAVDLKRLMGVSDGLAELNRTRFKAFKTRGTAADVPAALAFAGDVYTGLQARTLDAAGLAWAQDRLRILSGLYGLLRPLDAIQPYRLEMGVALATDRGETLYDFWGDKPAKALNAAARGHADRTVVNLASQEYFGGVDRAALKPPVLTCQFKDQRPGEAAKIVSFYAKVARGLMARFAIDERIERRDDLKAFDRGGYAYAPALSTDAAWVFTRPHP